jgi:hypothetical protein
LAMAKWVICGCELRPCIALANSIIKMSIR